MHDCPIDPEDFVLSLFGYGTKKGKEAETIQMHLLQGCSVCLRAVLERAGLSSFEELAALHSPTIELPLLYGRREISSLIDWLESLPSSDQENMMEKDVRLHRVAAVEEILYRCRSRWGAKPREALGLSNLALALLGWVPGSVSRPRCPQWFAACLDGQITEDRQCRLLISAAGRYFLPSLLKFPSFRCRHIRPDALLPWTVDFISARPHSRQ